MRTREYYVLLFSLWISGRATRQAWWWQHQGLVHTSFYYAPNSISLFVCLVGLDFKLIKGEKHWFLLCFALLEHLLFSLCLVLAVSTQYHPISPFHPSSIHFPKFLASIRHFLAPPPESAVLPYPPDWQLGLLVIFSPLLPPSTSCTSYPPDLFQTLLFLL